MCACARMHRDLLGRLAGCLGMGGRMLPEKQADKSQIDRMPGPCCCTPKLTWTTGEPPASRCTSSPTTNGRAEYCTTRMAGQRPFRSGCCEARPTNELAAFANPSSANPQTTTCKEMLRGQDQTQHSRASPHAPGRWRMLHHEQALAGQAH